MIFSECQCDPSPSDKHLSLYQRVIKPQLPIV